MFTSLISHEEEERVRRRSELQYGQPSADLSPEVIQERRRSSYKAANRRWDSDLEFRMEESPGYWTLLLLPVALYMADQKFLQQSLPAVSIIAYNSLLLFFIHWSGGTKELKEHLQQLRGFNLLMAVITMAYGYAYYKEDGNWNTIYEYLLWSGLNFSFPYVFLNIVLHYPRSFSFGEAIIVCSAFVYNYWASFHNIIQSSFSDLQQTTDPFRLTLFQELAFLATILILRFILVFLRWRQVFLLQELFTICTKAAVANFLGKLKNPVDDLKFLMLWIVKYLIFDFRHVAFIALWISLLAASVVFVLQTFGQQTTTIHRKFFHLLMCLVYFPVVLNDLNFIFFCSAVILYAFVVIETVRVLKFEIVGYRIGAFINNGVANFRDERDSGPLLLTPIYLLAGCSSTVWLTGLYLGNVTSTNDNRTPEEMAAALTGILSVGVGDTIASVIGTLYGKTRWPGSNKSVEGTLSSMFAQIMVVAYLCWSGFLPYTTISLMALCTSCVVNACVEASTDQIDNLVVPLVAFNTVHICIYFSDYFVS